MYKIVDLIIKILLYLSFSHFLLSLCQCAECKNCLQKKEDTYQFFSSLNKEFCTIKK